MRTRVFQCYFANMELLRNAVCLPTYTGNSDYTTSVGLAQARPNNNFTLSKNSNENMPGKDIISMRR